MPESTPNNQPPKLGCLVRDPRGDEPAVVEMRRKLDAFYGGTDTYEVFLATPNHSAFYGQMDPILNDLIARQGNIRVLELGAGRCGFVDYLGDRRKHVHFTAQDITDANRAVLDGRVDELFVGDIAQLTGSFDFIFSTFVFEHVSAPRPWLENVDRLLAPGGCHTIVCPRYDLPGYVCPSMRHHGKAMRARLSTRLALSRLAVRLGAAPRFWVNVSPTVFHRPRYRDADAVHLVSRADVERWHRARGYKVRRLKPPFNSWRDWVGKRVLLHAGAFLKPG